MTSATALSAKSEEREEGKSCGGGERKGLLRLLTSFDSEIAGCPAAAAGGEVAQAGDGVLGPGPGVTDVDEECASAGSGEAASTGSAGDANGVDDFAGLACISCRCISVTGGAYGTCIGGRRP